MHTAQSAPVRGLVFRRTILLAAACVVVAALFGGAAAGAPGKANVTAPVPITVNVIPISNVLPLDLGMKKGFFAQQGLEVKKVVLQSGNDIVLALANSRGEIGFAGWVPAMIARTSGIPITTVTTSEVEGTSLSDNWQNILVKGSSPIRNPADLAGKTIAVNALKGVGEVMIRAALEKAGVDQSSIKLLPVPFPAMRTALANGQVDAIWTPEPFLSQAINLDGARDLMAPGPVLGRYFPIGGYFARTDWAAANPDLLRKFRTAMNQSLAYAQANPNEVRELLPAATRNVRLPIWTTLVDRTQLLTLAKYAKKYGVITSLPNFTQLVPSSVEGGKTLQGTVGGQFITLRQDGALVTQLKAGKYTFVVTDNSKTQNFQLVGPGVNRKTSVPGTGRSTWPVTLKKGTYRYSSSARPGQKRLLRVT
jgi:NitT/TauT family transport system substrate-binding protein